MDLFHVSASPHTRDTVTTGRIMADVAIALIPASAFGVYYFGLNALVVLCVSMLTCVLTEYLYERLMKKAHTPYECSALVTGLLLGMNLPAGVPLWIPVIGGVFAILVVKQLYGGLGHNFMNPALAARCFLLICFAGRMTDFVVTGLAASGASSDTAYLILNGAAGIDGISGATPLAVLKAGGSPDLFDMFFGYTGGTIGETSALMLLIGAAYLLIRRVISIRIPLTYILTVVIFALCFGGRGFDGAYLLGQVLGGGLLLGAFFMATDYVTSPITPAGQIVFGALLGIFTGIFRIFGGSAEGVSYAIIFCNLLVPLIEKATMPAAFGVRRRRKG